MSPHAPRRSTIQRRGTGPRSPLRVQSLRNFDYPEAILFDCDGVLCETERDGHRVTFNMTFKENGLDHDWDVDTYGELLKIGGGKAMSKLADRIFPTYMRAMETVTMYDREERERTWADPD